MRILDVPKPVAPSIRPFGPMAPSGDQTTNAMPVPLRDLVRSRDGQAVELGESTLGSALGDAIRFRFDGRGPLTSRTIVGETAAAARLLDGERGAAVRDALKGVLAVLDRRKQPVVLTGLTLAGTTDAFVANVLISDAEARLNRGWKPSARELQQTARELIDSGIDQAYGVYDEAGWMHLDASTTAEFHERIAAGPNAPIKQGELVPTLQHELEHSITPSLDADFQRIPWLEEASAELLTQWKGAIGEMAQGMGIRQESSGEVAYRPQVEELTRWITRAGLDPKNEGDLPAVRDLLQGTALGQVPVRMASAIVAREGGDSAKLVRQIEAAFGPDAFQSPTLDVAA